MTPTEVGQRFSAKDVGQILAWEQRQDELIAEAARVNELKEKAGSAAAAEGSNNG